MRDAPVKSVAVGFFDGVHLGHQAILRGASSAITFRNHPLSVLAPARAPRLIMSLDDRLEAIRALGVPDVTVLDFNETLACEAPAEFAVRLGSHVRCGENWRFGAKGAGDAAYLRACGVDVTVVPYAEYHGERISSTRIRALLESGGIADANAMLGRPFMVRGVVFDGKGEGRKMGYPTVNLTLDMQLKLPLGVYVVQLAGRRAIANYGVAPTMGERAWKEPCLEVHFTGDPVALDAGARETVAFLAFLRPERHFEAEAALARQIAEDIRMMEAMR